MQKPIYAFEGSIEAGGAIINWMKKNFGNLGGLIVRDF